MAMTRAQSNRKLRQEALREQLEAKGLIQKVLENLDKIEQLGASEADAFELQKLKVSNEQRMRLINKYLPDLKASEVDMSHGITDEFKEFLAHLDGRDTDLPDGDDEGFK